MRFKRYIVRQLGHLVVKIDNWCWNFLSKRRKPPAPKYLSGKGRK